LVAQTRGNFVLFVGGSTRHDRLLSNGSSYRLRREEKLSVYFGRSGNRIQSKKWTMNKCSLLQKWAHPQFLVRVCAIVEATGELIGRDLKRLNMGLPAFAKQGAGRPHCRERIAGLNFQ
jgi:hypothetical protein